MGSVRPGYVLTVSHASAVACSAGRMAAFDGVRARPTVWDRGRAAALVRLGGRDGLVQERPASFVGFGFWS